MNNAPNIEVFFDGDCPVCRWEVSLYKHFDKIGRINWTNILDLTQSELPDGKSVADLLGKFHVRDLPKRENEDWHIGVDAFARIWRELPGFRWFSWIFAVPGIRQIAQLAYLGFIRWQSRERQKRLSNL